MAAVVWHSRLERRQLVLGDSAADGGRLNFQSSGISTIGDTKDSASRFEPEAASSATPRNIFVDLGANCGNSYLHLREKSPYWKTTTTTPNEDGASSPPPLAWDVYLWEANPQLVRLYLNDLAAGQTEHDTGADRIHILAAAAATQDTQMQFYLTADQEQATTKAEFRNGNCAIHAGFNPSGASSLLPQAKNVGHQHPVTVPALDFGRWLQELKIGDRDRLLIKIDIEGAEVELLQHVLSNYSSDFCRVESLLVEWHAFIFDDPVLKQKHNAFRQAFPEQFKAACGREAPLQGWH